NTDCSVEIEIDSAANGLVLTALPDGEAPFTYEWSTGDTTQTIPFDPNSFEEYCVWVTDATGCVAENCFFPWNNDCGVSLWYDCPAGGVPTIYAEAWGAPPFTYQWSTGEVTETINPTDSGEYCVTVTDAEDCVSESCIWVDVLPFDSCGVDIVLVQNGDWLYAEAWGVAPFTYLWSNGEAGSSIQIDPNISDYCVTVTDATGCVSEACYFITGVDCGVTFQVDTIPGTNLYEITAIPSGVAPFTVFWDGINSNEFTITADLPGTYCVVIEDATGCVATGCVTVGGGAGCDVSIVEVADSSNVTILWAEVYAGNPNTIIEYQWSTGENTPVIVVTQPGDYCVTITTSDGCVAEDCLNVPLTPNSDISGWVYVEDSLQVPVGMFGDVYLYRIDPNAGSPELVAQTPFLPFPFGYQYIFENQPAGQYLVRAVLAPDSPGFDDYLPTYYGDTELWSEAAIIELPAPGWDSYDIFLVPSEKLNGPGSISGLVLEGDGLLGSDDRGDGDPVEGVSVFLYDANDVPAGTSWTDQTGAFRFESLPWGTYKVLVEITGKSNAYYMVTIGPDQPQVTDLIFEINGNDATTGLDEKVAGSEIAVFPNPVSTEIQVVMQVVAPFDARFTITDVTGKVVFEQKQSLYPGKELLRFDVSHLPDGVFFLNVVSGKDILTKKIVKH
ncbi:MAG: T9SS C-terminal target domain-containing protein, partial [Bacteroidetes bacterium]